MSFRFSSLASGSSGNCYLVMSEQTSILIDLGISGKRIKEGLVSNGIEIKRLDGIMITHEHSDHIKSIKMIAKDAENANVYSTKGTLNQISDKLPENRMCFIEQDFSGFSVGDIRVEPFHLSHDTVDPVSYSFSWGGRKISIITDTGRVTDEIYYSVRDCDMLILEANHEVNMLRMSSYPYSLQRRILGDYGHLSNDLAGEFLCRIIRYRREFMGNKGKLKVALAHLSKENNTPAHALLAVKNALYEDDIEPDEVVELAVLPRDSVSPQIEI